MTRIYIFDLDGTVIDSAHRTPYFPNGDLNLEAYKRLATKENIRLDRLFPLAGFMRRKIAAKRDLVVICTAREMRLGDWEFLTTHRLRPHMCLSRNHIDRTHFYMSDAPYKVKHLSRFLDGEFKNMPKIMFEDNSAVIRAVSQMPGFTMVRVPWAAH